jgi:hypothetical protein
MFIVNTLGGKRLIMYKRRTIHHPCCRFASLSRLWHRIDATEVMRQHGRIQRGDGGCTQMCKVCRPDKLAAMVVDPT